MCKVQLLFFAKVLQWDILVICVTCQTFTNQELQRIMLCFKGPDPSWKTSNLFFRYSHFFAGDELLRDSWHVNKSLVHIDSSCEASRSDSRKTRLLHVVFRTNSCQGNTIPLSQSTWIQRFLVFIMLALSCFAIYMLTFTTSQEFKFTDIPGFDKKQYTNNKEVWWLFGTSETSFL